MSKRRLPVLDWESWSTPFVFFTGKGGVGKTTVACAAAVALADAGRRVLLVSTDPASNLTDVLGTRVGPQPAAIHDVANLDALNLDPEAAAADYRNRVIEPYRGVVPEAQLAGMIEQLAGECTVEVATFDQFTQMIVHPELTGRYDHILFDTSPTGHTLRLLDLPAAWSQYLHTSQGEASCLGPRSGLASQRDQYQAAVAELADPRRTTLALVSRPDLSALREAERAGTELAAHGITNQRLIINGLLDPLTGDPVAEALARQQARALEATAAILRKQPTTALPLAALDLTGIAALRDFVAGRTGPGHGFPSMIGDGADRMLPDLDSLIGEIASGPPGAILVMGKGGVGKTTIATALAVGLARGGQPVHLSTTDPAGRPADIFEAEPPPLLTVSRIDPIEELARYTSDRLAAAGRLDPQRRALLAEELRSPCTQELAVFRAFAGLLNQARTQFVVVDTAPSGHTLRLLDVTGSYHRQVMTGSAKGLHVTTPLMRLQDRVRTRVLIVTLPALTPVNEAAALQDDLRRAGIEPYGWIINAGLTGCGTHDPVLMSRANLETPQIRRVLTQLAARVWLTPWQRDKTAAGGKRRTEATPSEPIVLVGANELPVAAD